MNSRPHALLGLALLGALTLASSLAVAAAAPTKSARASGKGTIKAHSVLPFIEDDYTKALAQARARKLPLFIEAWAPW